MLAHELWFVDDIYGGIYNRFNTTLKWWPWVQAGALLTAGAYGLSSASRTCRVLTAGLLAFVSLYGVDLVRALARGPRPHFGRLDGAAWITDDPPARAILEYLQVQPPGIVLQRPVGRAYTPAPAMALFAGQQAFLGWVDHENLWRGRRTDVPRREEDVRRFYAGEMPEAADWLVQNGIAHVLWLDSEAQLPEGTFERIDAQLRPQYGWQAFGPLGGKRVGIWSRRR